MMKPIIVAMTGASGPIYGIRLVKALIDLKQPIHLVVSDAALLVMKEEMGLELVANQSLIDTLWGKDALPLIHLHSIQELGASIASGSYQTAGMVVCPCSTGTMGSIASGISRNLIERAAEVVLKERRKLILVVRETPLSTIQLGNMHQLSLAGAVILPAAPGFYHQPTSVNEMVDFIVARILDQLGIEHQLLKPWKQD